MPAITRELNIIARCGMQFRGERLKALGLTAVQAPMILHVCGKPGQSQEELARSLHVNRSNVTRQLALLEEAGFVTRDAKPGDRRTLSVIPLYKAYAVVDAIRETNRAWHDYLTQGMEDEEKRLLELLLEKMRLRAIAWDDGDDKAEDGSL